MNNIPIQVTRAASFRLDMGGKIKLIGKYKGNDVYSVVYDEAMTIGLPELYLWNKRTVKVVSDFDAVELLSKIPSLTI